MLEITIRITLAEGDEYTPTEAGLVAALTGTTPTHAAPAAAAAKAPAAPLPASKPPVAPKAVTAAKPATKAPAKPVEAEPEEEPESSGQAAALEEDEDLLGGGKEYTLEAAVASATKLVSAGKAAEVKAALGVAGAKKVSELKGKAIQSFIEALEA